MLGYLSSTAEMLVEYLASPTASVLVDILGGVCLGLVWDMRRRS